MNHPNPSSLMTDNESSNTILVNVLKNISALCKTEGEKQALMVPINEPANRITSYTGLSNDEISQLTSSKRKFPTLNLDCRIALHEVVKCMIENEGTLDYPGLHKSMVTLKELIRTTGHIYPKITTYKEFVEEMESLGYITKETIDNTKTIVEDAEVRFERYNYLSRIKKIRNSNTSWKQVVYIDERIISSNEKTRFQKIWPPTFYNTQADQTIFYHAVSKSGFINGLFSNQVTHESFCKWVTDILLGHLKEPSLIILDNNPLHCVLQNACPITPYHSKKEMLRWLAKHHIPCSSNMDKPALYELVKKVCNVSVEYKIDSIIRSQGHEVMRLPRFLYDLSITTPLWEHVNANNEALLRVCKSSHPHEFQNALIQLLYNIGLGTWNQFDKSIQKKERDILKIDVELDKVLDNFEFKVPC